MDTRIPFNDVRLKSIFGRSSALFFSIFFLIGSSRQVKADCTITSTINASAFLTTYGSCSGVMTIPNNVDLVMDASLSLPAGITKVIIASGGQIVWPSGSNGNTFTMADGTILVIQDLSPTSGTGAAIESIGSCNNTRAIFIGAAKYSACTGGGNVCILFSDLVAAGGTAQPTAGVTAGANVNGSSSCYPFGLNVTVTGAGTVVSYSWTQTAGPGTSTISNSTTANPTITSVTSAPGTYTYNVAVTVSAVPTGSTCTSTAQITVQSQITLTVYAPVSATGSGTPEIAAGTSILVSGMTATNQTMLSWTHNGAGSITSGGTTLTPTYTSAPGDKGNLVTLTMTASNPGCSTTANFTVLVRTKLPLTLTEFTGSASDCVTKLAWKATDAKNFKQFNVEGSKNGINFNTLAIIPISTEIRTNGSDIRTYTFEDKSILETNYYRLKMVDLDASFEYSQIIGVKNNCQTPTALIFPNPLTRGNDMNLNLSNFEGQVVGQLVDIAGRTLKSMTLTNGINRIVMTEYTGGMYWLKIKDEHNNEKTIVLAVTR